MAGFVYFVPERLATEFNLRELDELGIGHAFGPASQKGCRQYRGTGPDGKSEGTLVADDRHCPAARLDYVPDNQTWRRVPKSPCWVGMWRDARPGPDDLARETLLDGHLVTLGDGRPWLVPVARGINETPDGQLVHYTQCDRSIDWDDDGARIVGEIVPRYRPLWEAAALWHDAKFHAEIEEGRVAMEALATTEAALVGLAANYRLDRAEAGLLGLLTEHTEFAVLDAMIDWPSWEMWLKKKEASDGSSTDVGPPAAPPATPRP